jgi:hypothetical protein
MMQFQQAGVPHAQAVVFGGVVAVLPRLFQVIAELIMGGAGAALTRVGSDRLPDPIGEGQPGRRSDA